MANEMNALSGVTQGKGFLSRPEGKGGAVVTAVALAAIIWFFGSDIANYIITAMDNMLHMAVVAFALVSLGYVVMDANARALVFYIYRSVVRAVAGLIIDIDPIGVLKTYKERMEGKLGEMKSALDNLKGQRLKVTRSRDLKAKELNNEVALMTAAQAKPNDEQAKRQLTLHGKQATRLQSMLARYEGDLNRINLLITIMDRYYGLCEDTILDMSNEISFRTEERAYAKQSQNAVRSAMSILKGLPEKEMWDEGIAKLEEDYTQAIGEVEGFLDVTKNILSQADLQDSADASKAIAMLDEWQKKNSNVSLGGRNNGVTKAEIIQDAARQLSPSSVDTLTIPIAVTDRQYVPVGRTNTGTDDYQNLFGKK